MHAAGARWAEPVPGVHWQHESNAFVDLTVRNTCTCMCMSCAYVRARKWHFLRRLSVAPGAAMWPPATEAHQPRRPTSPLDWTRDWSRSAVVHTDSTDTFL
eukprot:7388320-Prymnesium_polylepis.1